VELNSLRCGNPAYPAVMTTEIQRLALHKLARNEGRREEFDLLLTIDENGNQGTKNASLDIFTYR
jgi:hypothetical protein